MRSAVCESEGKLFGEWTLPAVSVGPFRLVNGRRRQCLRLHDEVAVVGPSLLPRAEAELAEAELAEGCS